MVLILLDFLRDTRANASILICVAGVVVVALIGGGVEAMNLQGQKQQLKELANEASLDAAASLVLASADERVIQERIRNYVQARMPDDNIQVASAIDFRAGVVAVELAIEPTTYFPGPLSKVDFVRARSVASASGEPQNICMVSLNHVEKHSLDLRDDSRISAQGCAVYVNSSSKEAFRVAKQTNAYIDFVCVAGGTKGPVEETPGIEETVTDCPALQDPLVNQVHPEVGDCDHVDKKVMIDETLQPGTYCGGLTIQGATANLAPGIYVISNGKLKVDKGGVLIGNNVGFFMVGISSKVEFKKDSEISLTAPKDGLMAGLLMFAPDEDSERHQILFGEMLEYKHKIQSKNARRLVGTIYLPHGELLIGGADRIADQSEYTVVIAGSIELEEGPNFVLRSDYALSDIPVPAGVGRVVDVRTRLIPTDTQVGEKEFDPNAG